MSRKLALIVLLTVLSLLIIATLPEPEPSRVSASVYRRLVPTFTPTPPVK